MTNLDTLRADYPDLFVLCPEDPKGLEEYLRSIGVIEANEAIRSATKAGEGNMNCTLRVALPERSLIVKQSRPWVERYPQIEAPWDRILSEARFYLLTSPHEGVSRRMPRQIMLDPDNRVLVLEDLGESSDYTSLYGGSENTLSHEDAKALVDWLSALHAIDFATKSQTGLTNLAMRALNHEHLFRFPLVAGNGLDLDAITPGLAHEAAKLITSEDYVVRVASLGADYLESGGVLLHGDFFPGSWLRTSDGPAVIDPEFAFFGPAEFDVGVLLAHLHLASQPEEVYETVIGAYEPPAGFDWPLALEFCAVEIMRRLIGVAQLPLTIGIESKRDLLEVSYKLILSEGSELPTGLSGANHLAEKIAADQSDAKRA